MFFDIFKSGEKPSNVVPFPGTTDTSNTEAPEENPKLNANAPYTIGVNEHNCTQVRLGHSTLTMNVDGVISLIEDLAHSIRHQYKVEITKLD